MTIPSKEAFARVVVKIENVRLTLLTNSQLFHDPGKDSIVAGPKVATIAADTTANKMPLNAAERRS